MDYQSGCRPKALICAYFPGVALHSAGTALGQCLNVGIDGRTNTTKAYGIHGERCASGLAQ